MTEPTLDTLAQRLDRMESAVRRLVGALLALAMLSRHRDGPANRIGRSGYLYGLLLEWASA